MAEAAGAGVGGGTELQLGVVFEGRISTLLEAAIKKLRTELEKIENTAQGAGASLDSMLKDITKSSRITATQMGGIEKSLTNVAVQAKVVTAAYGKMGKEAVKQTQDMSKYTKNLSDHFKDWVVQTGRFFLTWRAFWAAYSGIGEAFGQTKAFQTEMGIVAGVVLATKEELLSLNETAYRVSKETGIALAEIAKGMKILSQAGLSAEQVSLAIGDISKMARATGSSFESSANLVTTSMYNWKIAAQDVSRITNVLTGAANYSKATIEGLNTAFSFLAPSAALAGYTLEQTSAVIATLTNAGLRMSTIGTGMSTLLGAMISQSARFGKTLEGVGLSFEDFYSQQGKLLPFAEILKKLTVAGYDLRDSFEGLQLRAARELATALNQGSAAFELMETRIAATNSLSVQFAKSLEPAFVQLQLLGNRVIVDLVKNIEKLGPALLWTANTLLKLKDVFLGFGAAILVTALPNVLKLFTALYGFTGLKGVIAAFSQVTSGLMAMSAASYAARNGLIGIAGGAALAAAPIQALGGPVWQIIKALTYLVGIIGGSVLAFKNWSSSADDVEALRSKFAQTEGTIIRVTDNLATLDKNMENMSTEELTSSLKETNKMLQELGINAQLDTTEFVKLRSEIASMSKELKDLYYKKSMTSWSLIDATQLEEDKKKLIEIRKEQEKYAKVAYVDPEKYIKDNNIAAEYQQYTRASIEASQGRLNKLARDYEEINKRVETAEREQIKNLRSIYSIGTSEGKTVLAINEELIESMKNAGGYNKARADQTLAELNRLKVAAEKASIGKPEWDNAKVPQYIVAEQQAKEALAQVEDRIATERGKHRGDEELNVAKLSKLEDERYQRQIDMLGTEERAKIATEGATKSAIIQGEYESRFKRAEVEHELKIRELAKEDIQNTLRKAELLAEIATLDKKIELNGLSAEQGKNKLLKERVVLLEDIDRWQKIANSTEGKGGDKNLKANKEAKQHIVDSLAKLETTKNVLNDIEQTDSNITLLRNQILLLTSGESSMLKYIAAERKNALDDLKAQEVIINRLGGKRINPLSLSPGEAKDLENSLNKQKVSIERLNKANKDEADYYLNSSDLIVAAKNEEIKADTYLSDLQLDKKKHSQATLRDAKLQSLAAKANTKLYQIATIEATKQSQASRGFLNPKQVQDYDLQILKLKEDLADIGEQAGNTSTYWDGVFRSMGQGVEDLSDSLASALTSTKSLKDSMANFGKDFLQTIAKIIMKMAVLKLLWSTIGKNKEGAGAKLLERMGLENPAKKEEVAFKITALMEKMSELVKAIKDDMDKKAKAREEEQGPVAKANVIREEDITNENADNTARLVQIEEEKRTQAKRNRVASNATTPMEVTSVGEGAPAPRYISMVSNPEARKEQEELLALMDKLYKGAVLRQATPQEMATGAPPYVTQEGGKPMPEELVKQRWAEAVGKSKHWNAILTISENSFDASMIQKQDVTEEEKKAGEFVNGVKWQTVPLSKEQREREYTVEPIDPKTIQKLQKVGEPVKVEVTNFESAPKPEGFATQTTNQPFDLAGTTEPMGFASQGTVQPFGYQGTIKPEGFAYSGTTAPFDYKGTAQPFDSLGTVGFAETGSTGNAPFDYMSTNKNTPVEIRKAIVPELRTESLEQRVKNKRWTDLVEKGSGEVQDEPTFIPGMADFDKKMEGQYGGVKGMIPGLMLGGLLPMGPSAKIGTKIAGRGAKVVEQLMEKEALKLFRAKSLEEAKDIAWSVAPGLSTKSAKSTEEVVAKLGEHIKNLPAEAAANRIQGVEKIVKENKPIKVIAEEDRASKQAILDANIAAQKRKVIDDKLAKEKGIEELLRKKATAKGTVGAITAQPQDLTPTIIKEGKSKVLTKSDVITNMLDKGEADVDANRIADALASKDEIESKTAKKLYNKIMKSVVGTENASLLRQKELSKISVPVAATSEELEAAAKATQDKESREQAQEVLDFLEGKPKKIRASKIKDLPQGGPTVDEFVATHGVTGETPPDVKTIGRAMSDAGWGNDQLLEVIKSKNPKDELQRMIEQSLGGERFTKGGAEKVTPDILNILKDNIRGQNAKAQQEIDFLRSLETKKINDLGPRSELEAYKTRPYLELSDEEAKATEQGIKESILAQRASQSPNAPILDERASYPIYDKKTGEMVNKRYKDLSPAEIADAQLKLSKKEAEAAGIGGEDTSNILNDEIKKRVALIDSNNSLLEAANNQLLRSQGFDPRKVGKVKVPKQAKTSGRVGDESDLGLDVPLEEPPPAGVKVPKKKKEEEFEYVQEGGVEVARRKKGATAAVDEEPATYGMSHKSVSDAEIAEAFEKSGLPRVSQTESFSKLWGDLKKHTPPNAYMDYYEDFILGKKLEAKKLGTVEDFLKDSPEALKNYGNIKDVPVYSDPNLLFRGDIEGMYKTGGQGGPSINLTGNSSLEAFYHELAHAQDDAKKVFMDEASAYIRGKKNALKYGAGVAAVGVGGAVVAGESEAGELKAPEVKTMKVDKLEVSGTEKATQFNMPVTDISAKPVPEPLTEEQKKIPKIPTNNAYVTGKEPTFSIPLPEQTNRKQGEILAEEQKTAEKISAGTGNAITLLNDMQSESNLLIKMILDLPRMIQLIQDMMTASTSVFGGVTNAFGGIMSMFGFNRGGLVANKIRGYAGGGRVIGNMPGRGNKDNLLAAVSPNEYIVPEDSTKLLGEKLLTKIKNKDSNPFGGENANKRSGFGENLVKALQQPPGNSYTIVVNATDAQSFSRMLATKEAQEMVAIAVSNKFTHNSSMRGTLNRGH